MVEWKTNKRVVFPPLFATFRTRKEIFRFICLRAFLFQNFSYICRHKDHMGTVK